MSEPPVTPICFRPTQAKLFGLELWPVQYVGEGTIENNDAGIRMEWTGPLRKERAAWWRLALWHAIGRWIT